MGIFQRENVCKNLRSIGATCLRREIEQPEMIIPLRPHPRPDLRLKLLNGKGTLRRRVLLWLILLRRARRDE